MFIANPKKPTITDEHNMQPPIIPPEKRILLSRDFSMLFPVSVMVISMRFPVSAMVNLETSAGTENPNRATELNPRIAVLTPLKFAIAVNFRSCSYRNAK